MADKLIMTFNITIDRGAEMPYLENSFGSARIIPFGGTVESELFTGTVLPGAADVQVSDGAGVRHMLAQYMFDGTDYTGAPCRLFVRNNGYFHGEVPSPFDACPSFLTDSKALGPYLHRAAFRAEGHPCESGVTIKIYEIDSGEKA